jgi:hypothetical protein
MPTDVLAPPPATDQFGLRGLVRCTCGLALQPLQLADESPAYRSPCGCRLWAVDAAAIEHRVYAAAKRMAPRLVPGLPADGCAGELPRLLVYVMVGGTIDDLTFVWRT